MSIAPSLETSCSGDDDDDDEDNEAPIIPLYTFEQTHDGWSKHFRYVLPGIGVLDILETSTTLEWSLGRYGHRRVRIL